jgi:signal transduction histidine kinase
VKVVEDRAGTGAAAAQPTTQAPLAQASIAQASIAQAPGARAPNAAEPPAAGAPQADTRWVPVAVIAPTGRDAAIAAHVLERAGFVPRVCDGMAELCAVVSGPPEAAGALLVAEEALSGPGRAALLAALAAQPSWSDLPLVVLTGDGELSRALSPALEAVAAHANVTLLERPVRVATLVTALRAALRARRRQLDVRDHLAERAAAERALRAARAQAEEARIMAEAANRGKAEFLATMSHELRTPLNAIGGYVELLDLGLRGPVTSAQHDDLARIQRAQRHLLGLINGLLNYAKVDAGAVDYLTEPVALPEVLVACEALVAPQLRSRALDFVIEVGEGPVVARADRDKVRQVVLNLLSNAVKFTAPGGQVRLTCSTAADGRVVVVRVSDTGIGIAPEQLGRVFEPFVQVDATLTRTQEGTGLGLAISRDLARGMGGDLTAESTLGVGTTFTLTLPAA